MAPSSGSAVVIGGGISGMSAALMLARHGRRVTLVEQADCLGPLVRRFWREGYSCDPGLHYVGGLHDGGPLRVFFDYLGLSDLVEVVP